MLRYKESDVENKDDEKTFFPTERFVENEDEKP
jgi:hypothetical protein